MWKHSSDWFTGNTSGLMKRLDDLSLDFEIVSTQLMTPLGNVSGPDNRIWFIVMRRRS